MSYCSLNPMDSLVKDDEGPVLVLSSRKKKSQHKGRWNSEVIRVVVIGKETFLQLQLLLPLFLSHTFFKHCVSTNQPLDLLIVTLVRLGLSWSIKRELTTYHQRGPKAKSKGYFLHSNLTCQEKNSVFLKHSLPFVLNETMHPLVSIFFTVLFFSFCQWQNEAH